jgi:DNA-binding transcriptional MocR family regulator
VKPYFLVTIVAFEAIGAEVQSIPMDNEGID